MQAAVQAGINIAYSVRRLYLAGARRFVLINSPDVGLIPESIGDSVTVQATEVSMEFNSWLAQYAGYLQTVPELSLQFFDLFALHRELVETYGRDAIRPCEEGPAEACDQTLFFDSIHPNARVHATMGERIAAQLTRFLSAGPQSSSSGWPSSQGLREFSSLALVRK
jgi:phospholipase/lecithinase/hemolysin